MRLKTLLILQFFVASLQANSLGNFLSNEYNELRAAPLAHFNANGIGADADTLIPLTSEYILTDSLLTVLNSSRIASHITGGNGSVRVWSFDDEYNLSELYTIVSPDRTYDNDTFGFEIELRDDFLGIGSYYTWRSSPHDGRYYVYNSLDGSFVSDFNHSPHAAQYFGIDSAIGDNFLCVLESGNLAGWNTEGGISLYSWNPGTNEVSFIEHYSFRYLKPSGYGISSGALVSFGDELVTVQQIEGEETLTISAYTVESTLGIPSGIELLHSAELPSDHTKVWGRSIVDFSGSSVVVSDPIFDNVGRVLVYPFNSQTGFSEGIEIKELSPSTSPKFGLSTKLYGDNILFISSPYYLEEGCVYIYNISDPTSPQLLTRLSPPEGSGIVQFGSNLFIESTTLAISAGANDLLLYDINSLLDHNKDGPYSYVPGFFTWEEARLDAIARGGHLATITSEDENNTVSSVTDDLVFLDPNPGAWIGATDEDSEGNWVWVTGEPFGYTPPDFNPDNYQGSQHYIVTNYREIGFWDDDFLTSSRGYILEKRDLVEWSQDFTSPVVILNGLGGLSGDTHAYTWSKSGNGLANGGSVTQDETNNKVVLELTDNGSDGEVNLHMVGPSTTNHRRFKPISHETTWEIDLIAFRNGQADLMLKTRGKDGYVKSTIAPSGVIKYSTWMADYDHTNFDNFSGPSKLRNSTNKPGIVIVDGGEFDPSSADPVTITISGNAVGTVNMNTAGNAVESVTLSDYGSGYTAEPTVTFAGGGMTVAPTVSFNYSTGNLLEEHIVQVDIALQENGTKNWSLLADGQTLTYIQSYNSTDDSISYYYSLTDGDGVTTGPIFITTLTAAEHSAGGLGFFDVSSGYKWAQPNNQDAVVITYKRYVGADAAVSTVGINSVAIEFTDNDGDPIIDPEPLAYTLNGDGTYSVTSCDESARGSLDIPSTYNGLPVTSIGNGAFSYCTNLSGITIPDSVTSIGEGAFSHCTNLSSITIPDSVSSIGSSAFSSCYSLSSITIPDSVNSIGNEAFYACSSLSSITIPDSVTSIGDYAFYTCSSLSSITIPDSVTSIGNYAFYASSSITHITIPNNVTSVGVGAFSSCTSLASITIPDSVTSIGGNAFGNTQASISFSRHLLEATEAERDARLTMDEVKDVRVGPTMIEVSSGKADITMTLEEASDLNDWSNATTSEKTIEVDAPAGTRFYRFKMAE